MSTVIICDECSTEITVDKVARFEMEKTAIVPRNNSDFCSAICLLNYTKGTIDHFIRQEEMKRRES